MSSDKSDEFSLDGLEDLDIDELGEGADLSLNDEEEGLDLDLSESAEDFSFADSDDVVVEDQQAPDEFSLTNIGINLSLSDDEDENHVNADIDPADELDLGDDLEEGFSLDESFDLSEDLEDDGGVLDDFSLDVEANEELEGLGLEGLEEGLSEDVINSEELVEMEEEISDPLKDYSAPKIKLDSEDLTEDVRAKLKEIDAIMEEDATNAALILQSTNFDDENEDEDTNGEIALDDEEFQGEDFNFASEEVIETAEVAEEVEVEVEDFLDDDLLAVPEDHNEEESLVGDLNLADLDLSQDDIIAEVDEEILAAPETGSESEIEEVAPAPAKKKKRKEKEKEVSASSQSLEEISQAYTGEMERTHATIANLRADREELLKRIEHLEEEKLLGHRGSLNLRAELDEKKIELTILRKKLNEEINTLKDNLRIYEEKVLILEEKNKHLQQEIDTVGQKNKIDVKRVMLRERELEQKLELLKADAETQIRNRDLKILELKRKVDSMEFDMESITQQEKKTLESRFELEDKLDKAIRTLRTAISTLEEDGERSSTLEAIKKNIDM